jgi:polyhydroxyalkanoate synthase
MAWRTLHPASRDRFVERERPAAARRLYYQSRDGWRAPLFRIEPLAGTSGEPLIIVHGLLEDPDFYRYGAVTLAGALREQGFSVYLLSYRADRHAEPPEPSARKRISAEAIVEQDLPAALEAVTAETGFARAFVLGHGFGGLLALALAGRRDAHLASVVAMGAPLVLQRATDSLSSARVASRVLDWLPGSWTVPVRAMARLGAPLFDEHTTPWLAAQSLPSRVRGALMFGADDPSVALLRSIRQWMKSGTPTLYGGAVDLCEGIAAAEVPLLVITGEDDPICPPSAGELALSRWGHTDRLALRAPGSHFDLVLGSQAPERVFAPLGRWLSERRRLTWARGASD